MKERMAAVTITCMSLKMEKLSFNCTSVVSNGPVTDLLTPKAFAMKTKS